MVPYTCAKHPLTLTTPDKHRRIIRQPVQCHANSYFAQCQFLGIQKENLSRGSFSKALDYENRFDSALWRHIQYLKPVTLCIRLTWHLHNHDMTHVMNMKVFYACLWQLSLSVIRSVLYFLMQRWHCLRCLCYGLGVRVGLGQIMSSLH